MVTFILILISSLGPFETIRVPKEW